MEKKKFEALLVLIVPKVVELIVKHHGLDEMAATKKFYESTVYSRLEEEETKLWHLSPLMLFHLYDEEVTTGSITFPEA